MTHKEEAIKRVEEFYNFVEGKEEAKQCALIAIEREIQTLSQTLIFDNEEKIMKMIIHLVEVKQEIEQL